MYYCLKLDYMKLKKCGLHFKRLIIRMKYFFCVPIVLKSLNYLIITSLLAITFRHKIYHVQTIILLYFFKIF